MVIKAQNSKITWLNHALFEINQRYGYLVYWKEVKLYSPSQTNSEKFHETSERREVPAEREAREVILQGIDA